MTKKNNLKRDEVELITKSYTVLADFMREQPRLYRLCFVNGWRDLMDHMERSGRSIPRHQIWTEDSIRQVVATCETYNEFRTQYKGAYSAVIRNGWKYLAKDLPRMQANTKGRIHWVIYKWTFSDNKTVYIGLTKHFKYRVWQELHQKRSPIRKFIVETGCTYNVEIIHDNLTANEASQKECEEIQLHREAGYTLLNQNDGGALGGTQYKCTDDELIAQVLSQFDNIPDLRTKNQLLYCNIINRGLLNELKRLLPDTDDLMVESIKKCVKKCRSGYDMRYKYSAEWTAMKRLNLTHLLDKPAEQSPRIRRSLEEIINGIKEHVKTCRYKTEFVREYFHDWEFLVRRPEYRYLIADLPSWREWHHQDMEQKLKEAIPTCETFAEFCYKYKNIYDYAHRHEDLRKYLEVLPRSNARYVPK